MPTPKAFCYVDETGQDTKGRLFIVAVVVTGEQRDDCLAWCEAMEQSTGKRRFKWGKADGELTPGPHLELKPGRMDSWVEGMGADPFRSLLSSDEGREKQREREQHREGPLGLRGKFHPRTFPFLSFLMDHLAVTWFATR
jgi:hypothetical protein